MRVGTRAMSSSSSPNLKDHPHACGDKRHAVRSICAVIPTRVGTSVLSTEDVAGLQDHPHACGDKNDEQADIVIKQGSSPRVWGQANDTAVLFRASV